VQVINREVSISVDCLFLAAEMAGLPLPSLLAPEPLWRSPDEQLSYRDSAKKALAAEGLWHGGSPTEEFAGTLSVLGRGGREFSAVVESPNAQYRLHVAASGRDAVFAGYRPSSGQVLLRPARADALAEDLIAEFPEASPGPGPGISVPESDLRQAINGASPRREVRRVLEVGALPRVGGGQIYAGFRDGLQPYRKTGNSCCTYYDTEQGRYLFFFTEEPGYERYVNVAQGRPETMIAKTYELLDHLRRRS
jgi:hypothetical protein